MSSTTLEQAFILFNLAIFSWAVSEQVTEDVADVCKQQSMPLSCLFPKPTYSYRCPLNTCIYKR